MDNDALETELSAAGHPEAIIDAILGDALARLEGTGDE